MNMRMTRRGAGILIALMLIAVPAAAAVMTQNFVSASVELNGACFTMEEGADAQSTTGWVSFATDVVSTGSVDLVQEVISIRGNGGNRMIYSDVAILENLCPTSVTVQFLPATDPGGFTAFDPPSSDNVWDDFTISFYLANTQTPGDVLTSSDWDEVLTVAGGNPTTPDTTSIPTGSTRRMAVVIDTDSSITSAVPSTVATLRWTAQIIHP